MKKRRRDENLIEEEAQAQSIDSVQDVVDASGWDQKESTDNPQIQSMSNNNNSKDNNNSRDIEQEISLRRKKLKEEEEMLKTMLGRARLERAILVRARGIIDERIQTLQHKVSSSSAAAASDWEKK